MLPRDPSAAHSLPFLETPREWLIAAGVLLLIAALNLGWHYSRFQQIIQNPVHTTEATVFQQYAKTKPSGKTYWVLHLRLTDGSRLITIQWGELKDLRARKVAVSFLTKKLTFLDYVRGFFAISTNVELLRERPLRHDLAQWIDSQHLHPWMQELYRAIFLGLPPSYELRQAVNHYGIAHLIAISGFHLGVLGIVIYTILRLPYRVVQDRYFPYRSRRRDLGWLTISVLFGYLLLLGAIPSVIRAFAMGVVGFLFYLRGLQLISFGTLAITVGVVLALFPAMLFSVGFWFSVCGVFYIFLFLHHTRHWKAWQATLGLNAWVFVAMLPVVHLFFPMVALEQLLSPILTLLFIPFYPLMLLLHLIGQGNWLDGLLLDLLHADVSTRDISTPVSLLVFAAMLSMGAMFRWQALPFLAILLVGFLLYLQL